MSATASCDDVRPCLSQGDGITYSAGSGVISARISGDAGNNASIGGDGGIYATTDCPTVRGCLSQGPGILYDPVTGIIRARLSGDAGNNIAIGGDNGLFVPSGAATVSVDCGISGDGSGGSPLTIPVGVWPFPCDIDTEGGDLYCDTTGRLRAVPPGGFSRFVQQTQTAYPDVLVPAGLNVQIEMQSINIINPDPCRDAFVLIEQEVEVSVDMPVGSSADWGIGTDAMVYRFNNGTTFQNDVHSQHTKVVSTIVPAGGVQAAPMRVTMSRGTGGATYNRVQTWIQAFIFNLA
ncbi:hypothetical protein [Streptomyces sp. H27-H5]|uniref:hypothetical protein n=1 Tax=Streptomyces sp. H27-H5 TaxID=2996460 RepID=UPI00226D5F0F|nr:hypothetical protein [Streptomyces sp. H27-H5]MCY0957755.1 hypothetical protein [Streptomyces sp. H27-H5]